MMSRHCQPFGMGQSANHLAWAKIAGASAPSTRASQVNATHDELPKQALKKAENP
jgi:hypothetical protein